MESLEALLGHLCLGIERELKPQLKGFAGMFIIPYLPQTWVFRSEKEVASLTVDSEGNARVRQGTSANADVTIEGDHAFLVNAFTERRRPNQGHFKATPHTPKGRTAFDLLRSRFGL